jgi:hypothetical protein
LAADLWSLFFWVIFLRPLFPSTLTSILLLHFVTSWCHSNVTLFCFRVVLNAYAICTWRTMHLVKLRHSNLPRYLGLTSTFKQVGLILVANFPSGPRPCCLGLPPLVFRPNRKLRLVWRLDVPKPTPQAPFLKPSLANTYATLQTLIHWHLCSWTCQTKSWTQPNT